jgi:type IV secretion system protein VirB8
MAEGVETNKLLQYFKDARSWDEDRALKARRDRRTAYAVAGGCAALAIGAIAFHVASPIRSFEPYVIRVDKNLGTVDVVNAVRDTSEITSDEAVNKYFLSQYVRQRESWEPSAASEMFHSVGLFSSGPEQDRWLASRRKENPAAPVNLYQNGETVGVRLRGVSFINARVAQVRFSKIVQTTGGLLDTSTDWIATIDYKYASRPSTESDRLYNPLGFQVVSYRADPEISR